MLAVDRELDKLSCINESRSDGLYGQLGILYYNDATVGSRSINSLQWTRAEFIKI